MAKKKGKDGGGVTLGGILAVARDSIADEAMRRFPERGIRGVSRAEVVGTVNEDRLIDKARGRRLDETTRVEAHRPLSDEEVMAWCQKRGPNSGRYSAVVAGYVATVTMGRHAVWTLMWTAGGQRALVAHIVEGALTTDVGQWRIAPTAVSRPWDRYQNALASTDPKRDRRTDRGDGKDEEPPLFV